VLVEMLRVADEAPVDGVALADEGRARPLPSTLRTEACREVVPALLDAGERRLRMVLDALRIALIDEVTWTALDPARGTLRDIDTPEDLLPGGERRLPGFGATPG
jgi:molybdopterin-guanine dinucleotide biosynthesis protein A